MTGGWLLADNNNLIAQVVAMVMQFDTASQNTDVPVLWRRMK